MDLNDFDLKFIDSYFCDLKLLKSREICSNDVALEKWGDTIYGLPIPTAIRTITTYRTIKKFEKTSLEEFLKAWKKEFYVISKKVDNLKKILDENKNLD